MKKSRIKRAKLSFDLLEKRKLLAPVAFFAENFPSNGESSDGWSYQWNTPLSNNYGNPIDAPNLQLEPLKLGDDGSHTVDGLGVLHNSGPGGFLRFQKAGSLISGHPGLHSMSTGQADRFAVASYTVGETGFYTLEDSKLDLLTSTSADGVEFFVFLNSERPLEYGVVDPGTIGYFDAQLGYLAKGETINVAYGAAGNHVSDNFLTDFTISIDDDRTLHEAGYRADFSTTADPDSNWSYHWNQPTGWVADADSGDLTTGRIGDPSSYQPLIQSQNQFYWSPDGNGDWDHAPDYQLQLRTWGGRTGAGYVDSSSFHDRYAIAAYTVDRSGHYGLNDAFIRHTNDNSDGVEVVVHVDDGPILTTAVTRDNVNVWFDTDLGYLEEGSTIYVAYGGNENNDLEFQTDFKVERIVPRSAPDLGLLDDESLAVIKVKDFTGTDWKKINSAFSAIQDNTPTKIVFEDREYFLGSPDDENGFFFDLSNRNNVLIEGNNATLLMDDDILNYSRGMFQLGGSDNVIFQDLTIDYATCAACQPQSVSVVGFPSSPLQSISKTKVNGVQALSGKSSSGLLGGGVAPVSPDDVSADDYIPISFTQGTIMGFGAGNSNSIILEIDGPDTFLVPELQHGNSVQFQQGYAIDPTHSGRLEAGTDWHYTVRHWESGSGITPLGGQLVEVDLNTLEGLTPGDRFVLQRRPVRGGSVFRFANSNNVTVSNVDVYAAPEVFVISQSSSNINVLNSNVEIRPGSTRLKSINADGIHAQSNRTGVWVENTKFEGLGDDVMNFYTLPSTIHAYDPIEDNDTDTANDTTTTFEVSPFYFGAFFNVNFFNGEFSNYSVGDELSFMNPQTGKVIKNVRIAAVDHGAPVTVNENDPSTPNDDVIVTTVRLTIDQPIAVSSLSISTETNPPLDPKSRLGHTTVYNKDVSQDFYVADSVLSNSRRYGNFVMADNVHLVDNLYDGLSDQAIAGHTEQGWPLGLFAEDILVQGNEFANNGFSEPYLEENNQRGVVGFYMDRIDIAADGKITEEAVDETQYNYSDIEIRDNVFYHWNKSAISVRNAERVNVLDNIFMAGYENAGSHLDNVLEIQFSNDVVANNNVVIDYDSGELTDNGNSDVSVTNETNVLAPEVTWIEFDEVRLAGEDDVVDVVSDEPPFLIPNFQNRTGFTPINLGATVTSGRFDRGARFDGGEEVRVNDGSDIVDALGDRTVSVWFKQDDSANGRQVIYEEGNGFAGLNIYLDAGNLIVGRWNDEGASFTFIDTAYEQHDEWAHVALVLDNSSSQLRGYLNGKEFGEAPANNITNHGGSISIGRGANTRFRSGDSSIGIAEPSSGLVGSVDDFRVYDSVLTERQIRALALTTFATPHVVDDIFDTAVGEVLQTNAANGLLINDTNSENLQVLTQSASASEGGSVAINPDGTFTYTPGDGFIGQESFVYEVEDITTGLTAQAVATIDVVERPMIESIVLNAGDQQRSVVDELVVNFHGLVDLDEGAFSIIQRNKLSGPTGTSVGLSFATEIIGGDTVATIIFTSSTRAGTEALVDGNYELTIDQTKVTRAGTTVAMTEDYVFGDEEDDDFYSLFGATTSNRTVTVMDLLKFRNAYSSSEGEDKFDARFDFNGDGIINSFDLLAFRQRYGETLEF